MYTDEYSSPISKTKLLLAAYGDHHKNLQLVNTQGKLTMGNLGPLDISTTQCLRVRDYLRSAGGKLARARRPWCLLRDSVFYTGDRVAFVKSSYNHLRWAILPDLTTDCDSQRARFSAVSFTDFTKRLLCGFSWIMSLPASFQLLPPSSVLDSDWLIHENFHHKWNKFFLEDLGRSSTLLLH